MNICSYSPIKYLNNKDIDDRLKFLFKTVCQLAGAGIPGSGTVTSVGISMPAAFTVTSSPVTTAGTIAITGAGTTAQYIRGNGTLATLPTTLPLSSLTAAAANNTIDHTNYNQNWLWNSLSGNGLRLISTSTAAAGNGQRLLNVLMQGANANASQSTVACAISNIHSGTSSTNYALVVQAASGSTDNIGLWCQGGSVDIGLNGFETGKIRIFGATSGSATITVPTVAATPVLTLPIVTGTIVQYAESSAVTSATPSPTGDARENYYDLTNLAEAATFAAPSGTPVNHNSLLIRITGDATPRALTWNAIYRASSAFALPTTTVASKTMYIQFVYNSLATKWDALGLTQDF